MKITCTKEEFATLVRSCETSKTVDCCRGCIFAGWCDGEDFEKKIDIEIVGG